jgi:hydrogenase maturation protease
MSEKSVVVIGVGNPDRGDDVAGRLVARRLAGRVPVLEQSGEATALVESLREAGFAILVDACSSGAPAGTVRRFDASVARLPARTAGWSSHGLSLADAVELARTLGTLPARCVVYSIEGRAFSAGAAPTAAVLAAVETVAEEIAAEFSAAADREPIGEPSCTKPR